MLRDTVGIGGHRISCPGPRNKNVFYVAVRSMDDHVDSEISD